MLKPFNQALDPDPRFASSSNAAGTGVMTFADHYDDVAALRQPANAPDDVRTSFSRGLQSLLYAWFDYELMPLAEGQALAAVENAMRARVGPLAPKTKSLSQLFDVAYKHLILQTPDRTQPNDYDFVIRMRNQIAHGSTHISSPPMVFTLFEICADLIDELFP
jgi:hypothetical protein